MVLKDQKETRNFKVGAVKRRSDIDQKEQAL